MDLIKKFINDHLIKWGLRSFKDNNSYEQWAIKLLNKNKISDDKINAFLDFQDKMDGGSYNEKQSFYEFIAKEEIFTNITHSTKFNALVENAFNAITSIDEKTSTVLDLGCNLGYLTSCYADYFKNHEFVGYDICESSINKAYSRNEKRKNLKFFYSYEQLENYSFHYIIDTQCLCTINDQIILNHNLQNLKKIIYQDGSLISISTLKNIDQARQFVEVFKQNDFYVHQIKPIFINHMGGKEVYTKLLFKNNNQEYKINFTNYFNNILNQLNSV